MARTPLQADDPRRIGHYRLTARLGVGGMGVVYLGVGWDGSQVAVKLLRPELADDQEFRRRFGREVAALVRVKGECTVRVIEADSQSPRPFLVTEYAEGPSLAEHIKTHKMVGPDMLYDLATGLAEALTTICRSKRPGRSKARSSTSGRFVAARTTTPTFASKPSMPASI